MAEPIEIFLIEDNHGDRFLILDSLASMSLPHNVNFAIDGIEALQYLRQQGQYINAVKPHLIIMDLKLPLLDGLEILAEIIDDPELNRIPIVVLTSSDAEVDISKAYELNASAYVVKPVDLAGLDRIIKAIGDFWLSLVRYPSREDQAKWGDQPNFYEQ
jgi:CheY-like chemotaxis protein